MDIKLGHLRKSDTNKVVGAVLMDLSKAFDCIPHGLLIAKLAAYNFDKGTLEFMLSYLTSTEVKWFPA